MDIAITAAIIILCPKETKEQEQKRVSAAKAGFDFKGVVLLTIAFLSLGLELQLSGSYWKWTSGISIGLVVIFIAAIVVFVILERKREAENKSVAFQVSLFKNKLFVLSALSGLFITISTNGFSTYLPSFTQEVMNLSATVSGLATALTNIAGLVSGLAVGYVYGTKRWFKSFTAIAAVIATLASWALFGLGDKLTPTLFIILTVFGRGLWNTFLASISMVVVQTFAKESELVSFTSGIGTLTVVGAYLGIAVNSAIINLTGYAGMFITAGIVTLLGLLCILVIRIPKQEELS